MAKKKTAKPKSAKPTPGPGKKVCKTCGEVVGCRTRKCGKGHNFPAVQKKTKTKTKTRRQTGNLTDQLETQKLKLQQQLAAINTLLGK